MCAVHIPRHINITGDTRGPALSPRQRLSHRGLGSPFFFQIAWQPVGPSNPPASASLTSLLLHFPQFQVPGFQAHNLAALWLLGSDLSSEAVPGLYFCFERGSYYVAQADLELTLETRLALK